MQYKIEKTANGWRFTLGNITTFFNDKERQELIAALIFEDPGLAGRMAEYLESTRLFQYCLPACMKIVEFLSDPEQFYGWRAPQHNKSNNDSKK